MKIISAVSIIGCATAVAWTRYRLQLWERAIHAWEGEMLGAPVLDVSSNSESWNDLPLVVQRYLLAAVSSPEGQVSTTDLRSLRFSQTGSFLTDPKAQWTSFTAQQTISANPPGFVWDASVAMFPQLPRWPMVQVCDAWVQGKAALKVALLNVWEIPFLKVQGAKMQAELDQAIELGEAMRWLAESFLVPTSLFPHQGMVDWSAVPLQDGSEDPTKAILRLDDSFGLAKALVVVTFDETTGMPTSIEGERPKWVPTTQQFEMVEWRGFFDAFEPVQVHESATTVVVPTHMKVGWIDPISGTTDYYFDGYNHDLHFLGFSRPETEPLQQQQPEQTTVMM